MTNLSRRQILQLSAAGLLIGHGYADAHFNLALMYLDRKPPALELARRHYEKAVSLGAEKDEVVEEKLKEK